jgi:triacylglycerol esterase/lipase EstA (alpha/beta hydrolase family)
MPRAGNRAFLRRVSYTLIGLGAAASMVVALGGSAVAASGPPQSNFVSALFYSVSHPTASPAGANDFSCQPSAAHPNPVVLVHGTFENRYANWAELSPKLANAGYCVFALNYGGRDGGILLGNRDIPASAGELRTFVNRVLTATGASKVDIVGHSQGGMMPRYYIKNLGGAAKVGKLVGLVPSNHGTTLFGLAALAELIPPIGEVVDLACAACTQQIKGSDFMQALNAGSETSPGVHYTVIATRYDEVVTPYTSSFLANGPNVDNILLQDVCPFNFAEHIGISYDRAAISLVVNALDPAGATPVRC